MLILTLANHAHADAYFRSALLGRMGGGEGGGDEGTGEGTEEGTEEATEEGEEEGSAQLDSADPTRDPGPTREPAPTRAEGTERPPFTVVTVVVRAMSLMFDGHDDGETPMISAISALEALVGGCDPSSTTLIPSDTPPPHLPLHALTTSPHPSPRGSEETLLAEATRAGADPEWLCPTAEEIKVGVALHR